MANANYAALGQCKRRTVRIGDLDVALQFNPARAVSTAAKTDAASIARRACFLCKSNRPVQQQALDCPEGWDFLVNPYPIFPTHFTIASREHQPQGAVPPEMAILAEQLPGMAVFFNGARAGASAPDHLHFQSVIKDELPLLRLVERHHALDNPGIKSARQLGIDLPYGFYSAVISPDESGAEIFRMMLGICGVDNVTGNPDRDLVNTYFWTETPGAPLRILAIPRSAHRPSCYGSDHPHQHLVSPGAVDMAGVIVLPRLDDFENLTSEEITTIYSETGIPQHHFPF